LPIYEEAASLEDLLGRIQETLRRERISFEVIAVDDGSGDETRAALGRLWSRHRGHLVVIRHLTNKGNGAALRSGIRVARGDVVVTMDADGQHAPEEIPSLLKEMPPYDSVARALVRIPAAGTRLPIASTIPSRAGSLGRRSRT
jgi:glycosyltransferase involved in cell wall biosynthesis